MGASKEKLILGIPTYGRSFTLSSSATTPPNALFSGAGNAGPILNQGGFLGYQEICLYLKNKGWTEASAPIILILIFNVQSWPFWLNILQVDDADIGPYAYKNNQWVGYDTVNSAKKKADYIIEKDLGGAMFWETSTDDFNVKYTYTYLLFQYLNKELINITY